MNDYKGLVDNVYKPNIVPFLVEGEFYYSIGVKAFQKHEFNKAQKWLKRAVELSPDNPLYQCQLSVLYTELGSYHKANQILAEVMTKHGHEYVDCYYLIANNYAHLGLFKDAQTNIELYLAQAPKGEFSKEAKQLLEVLELYNEESDDEWKLDDEDDLLAYQETAFYHIEHEEWEQALVLLEEVMALYPDYKTAKHDYAFSLFFSGDEEEAIKLEEEWLERDRHSFHSQLNLALFYYYQNKKELCNAYIEPFRNVYPIHEQPKLKLAVTFAQTGRYEEAYRRFKSLGKGVVKGHLSYFKWYSIATYRIGMPAKALEIWEDGCKRHPYLANHDGPWKDDTKKRF
ncbi:tetratricopeptide repeat protein [Salirhabdus salicampi]|uniref:tetratricopeptide repeat protein n=1 Tax=Salirhabdus salicampi TaxID=476102 RepID=UPI0020C1F216|nr:tetratricopeptide repeat protein [Salirhabdus salicampi]MCP8617640.1 hypothetical protein [Salirhabdus salicampi]